MELLHFLLQTSRKAVVLAVVAATLGGVGVVGVLVFTRRFLVAAHVHGVGGPLFWAFVAMCAAALLAHVASRLLLLRLSRRAVARLTLRLGRQVLATPLRQLETLGRSRIQATFLRDVPRIGRGLRAVPLVCASLAILVGCLAVVCYWAPFLLWGVLAAAALGLSGQWLLLRGRRKAGRGHEDQEALLRQVRHLVEGVQELQINWSRRQVFLVGSLQASAEYEEKQRVAGQFPMILAQAWGRLVFFALIGFIVFGLPLLQHVSRRTLGWYLLAMVFLWRPAASLGAQLPHLGRARKSLRRLRAVGASLAAAPDAEAEPAPLPPWTTLELAGVGHAYGRERDGRGFGVGPLDLTFRRGEVVYLGGGNGSGKTTLVKLLTGLYEPQEGEIRLDGRPLRPDQRESYRQLFSAVFSDYHLFPELIGVRRPDLEERAKELLARLHLDRKVKIRQGAFSTTKLSRGQRKRLALLVAYLEDRPFYVFDEWAADQDPYFKDLFYTELLADLKARGKAVLVITHDERYYPLADRVVYLEEGQLRAPPGASPAGRDGPPNGDGVAGPFPQPRKP